MGKKKKYLFICLDITLIMWSIRKHDAFLSLLVAIVGTPFHWHKRESHDFSPTHAIIREPQVPSRRHDAFLSLLVAIVGTPFHWLLIIIYIINLTIS